MTAHDTLQTATQAAVDEYNALVSAKSSVDYQLSTAQQQLLMDQKLIAELKAQIANPPTTGLPALPAGWTKPLFTELFDGPLNPSVWTIRNDSGQNNNSANNLASNVSVSGGVCSIKSGKNAAGSADPYNAGYIDTKGKKSWAGEFYLEARMRFPWGTSAYGIWDACWMRPDDSGDGEIDLMEMWPSKSQVSATIHHDYLKTAAHVPHVGKNYPATDWTTWNTFGLEKTMGGMKFYLNRTLVWDASSVPWRKDIFDNSRGWHIRHCRQIGGDWGGMPTPTTDLSKPFDTDYIRVYGR